MQVGRHREIKQSRCKRVEYGGAQEPTFFEDISILHLLLLLFQEPFVRQLFEQLDRVFGAAAPSALGELVVYFIGFCRC